MDVPEEKVNPDWVASRLSNPQCESEQLQASGTIQDFGALFQFDAVSRRIGHASANIEAYIGIPALALLGSGIETFDWLREIDFPASPALAGKRLTIANIADAGQGRVDAVCIHGDGVVTVEIEPVPVVDAALPDHRFMLGLMAAPTDQADLASYRHHLAAGIAAISGYARVMIYQFMEDWSGEVVTHVGDDGMESYLGLRFPATDIPRIARELYLLNPCRMIPDSAAVPVPVLGLTAAPPDLTWSDLRSVSPAHLDYLAAMGVRASLSIPIRLFGKLWGLVVCHHLTPRLLRVEQRGRCLALASQFALGMKWYLSSRRLQVADGLNWRLDAVLSSLSASANPIDGLQANQQALLLLMSAQGVALLSDNAVAMAGTGLSLSELTQLDAWFVGSIAGGVFMTRQRSTDIPLACDPSSPVCGVMAVKLRSSRSGWLRFYWFRPAEVVEVVWAGNPDQPVSDADPATPSPRRSFRRWSETMVDCSRPWSAEDKFAALRFSVRGAHWL